MTESLAAEFLALGVGASIVAWAPLGARRVDDWIQRILRVLGRAPRMMPWVLGAVTAAVAIAGALYVHWPEPSVHDEFAYLLGAETFAGGELTRPTHPLWHHFETFHVLHEPSYAPKYPTGQSLALALGMVLFDEPRAGLWLEAGAMIAALTWMLFQWLPGRWALVGGLLMALQLGVRGPWVQTFYGGALAATGGALLLGAVPGVQSKRSVRSAFLLGIGLVILATTRPFEGLVVSLPVALVLLRSWVSGQSKEHGPFTLRVALPIVLVLSIGGFWLAAHNAAVTGDSATLPYMAYDAQYSVFPAFLWQEVKPAPLYRSEMIEWFMLNFQRGDHGLVHGPLEAIGLAVSRALQLVHGIVGLPLAVWLLVCCAGWAVLLGLGRRGLPAAQLSRSRAQGGQGVGERSGSERYLPLAVVLAVAAGSSVTTYAAPHYAAPALGALTVLLVGGLRRARVLSRRLRGRSVPLVLAAFVVVGITTLERGSKSWLGGARRGGHVRSLILERMANAPGRDLILVKMTSIDSIHQEFVFNAADIDAAPVVWARDLATESSPGANEELLRYYEDRHVWHLTLDHVLEDRWELVHLRGPNSSVDVSAGESSTLPWGPW